MSPEEEFTTADGMHQKAIDNANALIRAPEKLLTRCLFAGCEREITNALMTWKDYTKKPTTEAFSRHFAAEHDF